MTPILHRDKRRPCEFEIETTATGRFAKCRCFVFFKGERLRGDPIIYSTIEDIPEESRKAIQKLLLAKRREYLLSID